ncbi:MAG: cytochrome c peroxidase [Chloroherpetonaceae bacterium]|nr:cytochrome c peroxidase [Chloroherpetonaceae bacterium]
MTYQHTQRAKGFFVSIILFALSFYGCTEKQIETVTPVTTSYPAVENTFGDNIVLTALEAYSAQTKPNYITKNNGSIPSGFDAKATLGRVLFYDKKLSVNNTVACASCHQQSFGFSDTSLASKGINGNTPRHSMRLINSRYAVEVKFFWDERAASLEAQTTQPIQDHLEMGFSGEFGNPNFQGLLEKLKSTDYYQELFQFVYGDQNISEQRIQESLSAFIRSIQSFDSKYDAGRTSAVNDAADFANYTADENAGKRLFLAAPQFNQNGVRVGGGAGCGGCHRAPEFDIDPASLNNGVISKIGGGTDVTVTRSPTLRDILNTSGQLNGAFMHDGSLQTLKQVINHYNLIQIGTNTNLDPRLRPGGRPQNLALTENEKNQLEAFLKTLSGSAVYSHKRWSNPFLTK